MPTRAFFGVSALEDAVATGREAARAAVAPLPDGRADLALVFATSEYQQQALIDTIQSVLPQAQVLGCSGEGVIAQDESLEASAAVAVMAIASTAIRFDTFVVDEYALQPAEAGKRLGQMVKAKVADPKCLCILSDGLMGNCTDFLKALHDEMGAVPIVGGGLTEGNRIQLTRRDPEKIKRSAQSCAARVLDSHNGEAPAFVLQFDCADRGRILFGACTAAEIVVPLRKTLGATTPWLGFHTHGEIAPLDGRPYYHNYTVGLFAVYDRAA